MMKIAIEDLRATWAGGWFREYEQYCEREISKLLLGEAADAVGVPPEFRPTYELAAKDAGQEQAAQRQKAEALGLDLGSYLAALEPVTLPRADKADAELREEGKRLASKADAEAQRFSDCLRCRAENRRCRMCAEHDAVLREEFTRTKAAAGVDCRPVAPQPACPCCEERERTDAKQCGARDGTGYVCTLRKGHKGREHVAHGGEPGYKNHVCARWPVEACAGCGGAQPEHPWWTVSLTSSGGEVKAGPFCDGCHDRREVEKPVQTRAPCAGCGASEDANGTRKHANDCSWWLAEVRRTREARLVALVNAVPEWADPNAWRAAVLAVNEAHMGEPFGEWGDLREWLRAAVSQPVTIARSVAEAEAAKGMWTLHGSSRWHALAAYRRALAPAAKVTPERRDRGPRIVCDNGED